MGRLGKLVTLVVALVLGAMTLTVVLLGAISSPRVHDACVPVYESCAADADGLLERIDCRIELLHCRRYGVDHDALHPERGSAH